MTDHHRDEFEAYMRGRNACVRLHRQRESIGGYYRTTTVQRAWELWQESRRTYRASEWQSIETAPRDGSEIMLSNGLVAHEGHWLYDEGGTVEHRDMDGRYIGQDDREGYEGWIDWGGGMLPEPTHWQPLPAPPLATQTPGCRGTACGTTTGEHSAECVAEHLKGLFREDGKP